VKQKFGSTVSGSTSESQSHASQPQQPFSFGTFVSEPAVSSSSDEGHTSTNIADDDMEIGQGDEALPHPMPTARPTPPIWNIPTTSASSSTSSATPLFGSQPDQPIPSTGDAEGNQPQVPKKKVTNSALKRRLKGSKKLSGKEDLSKLDSIFANISLKQSFQTEDSAPSVEAEKVPFIFFPPPTSAQERFEQVS
jgi:hypothetical protein